MHWQGFFPAASTATMDLPGSGPPAADQRESSLFEVKGTTPSKPEPDAGGGQAGPPLAAIFVGSELFALRHQPAQTADQPGHAVGELRRDGGELHRPRIGCADLS